MDILLATNNQNKIKEIKRLLLPRTSLQIKCLSDVGISIDPEETGETYDCIVSDKELYFVGEFSLGIRTSIRNERFVENSIFKIEKEIEYMTFQEVAITGKRLRLNEEWSKKIRDDYEEVFEDKQREEDKLVVSYLSGEYLSLQDMLIVLGWFLSGEDLRELLSSNEKVWCVEE